MLDSGYLSLHPYSESATVCYMQWTVPMLTEQKEVIFPSHSYPLE